MRKLNALFIATCFVFVACGGDSSSNTDTQIPDSGFVADTFDDLPVCNDKRKGTTVYIKNEKNAYICENGGWMLDDGSKQSLSSSSHYEQKSSANVQPPEVAVRDKSISGVSQKGPFVTGSAVKLYELDGLTCTQTGKSFTGKIATDDGKFNVSSVTLASQYALLESNGYFRNEVSGSTSSGVITLNALTDLTERENVNINLLTHLEYERVLYLVSTGINLPAAKKKAEMEIFNAFGIQGDFANFEDLDIFSKGEGDAALLAFSVLMLRDLNEADLTELLTKFATDVEKDGYWDDQTTKAKIADWAQAKDLSGSLATIRDNIEKWNLGTVPDFEKYIRNFWYVIYGLGPCNGMNNGEVAATKNVLSYTYGTKTRYICKSDTWVEAKNSDDTYGKECSNAEVGKIIVGAVTNTNKYYCTENGWINMSRMEWNWDMPKEVHQNPEISYRTMTDTRDNKVYKIVTIGSQTWMAENLNYYDASNLSVRDKSWCWGKSDGEDDATCDVAGRFYTWAAAIDSAKLYKEKSIDCGYGKTCALPDTVYGICPPGWHLPNKTEWNRLINVVGGPSTGGKVLKSQSGWRGYGTYGDGNGNGTDAFGFFALPFGIKGNHGVNYFSDPGTGASFWSATENDEDEAYDMGLINTGEYVRLLYWYKDDAFSIRCVENQK